METLLDIALQLLAPLHFEHSLLIADLPEGSSSGKEIARRVTLAPTTVRNVVQVTYRKLGINNKAQLARLMANSHHGYP